MNANYRDTRGHTPPAIRSTLLLLSLSAALVACAPAVTLLSTATAAPAATVTLVAPSATPAQTLSNQDQIDIYAAVLRQVYGPDDTFGGTLQAKVSYVIRQPDDAAGGTPASGAALPPLAVAIQTGISGALAGLPTKVVWVDQFTDVPRDTKTGAVAGNGAVFRVGGIAPQPDGRVQVAGSIYVASLAAGGTTYVVERQGARWMVTGKTGSQWIS